MSLHQLIGKSLLLRREISQPKVFNTKPTAASLFFFKQNKTKTKVMCLFYDFILDCTGSLLRCAWLRLSCPEACGSLGPQPGIELVSPALKGEFFTTGLPGKSHSSQLWWESHSPHLEGFSSWLDESFRCLILVSVTPRPSFLEVPVLSLTFQWTHIGILCPSSVSVCLFSLSG